MTPEDFLNQDKSHNIRVFEKGDFITRVNRSEFKQTFYNENLGIQVETIKYRDGSYLGEKMEFLGIYNRHICVKKIGGYGDGEIRKLHMDQWQDGWQKYEIPEFDG